jgi:threonine dehydrogenase-like Zn-dependent dehydrogenase
MRGAIIYGPGDVRVEERPAPTIVEPTDAVIRTVATCVCGSDPWRYRGLSAVPRPTPIGREYVGTEEARLQAVACARPGARIGLVGVSHGDLPTDQLFWSNKGIRGWPAPVRAYLPHLIDLVWTRQTDPGTVFDLTLPLSETAEAYRAMDERRAIKVLLQPEGARP